MAGLYPTFWGRGRATTSYLLQGGHGSWRLPTNLAEECYVVWNCRVGTVDRVLIMFSVISLKQVRDEGRALPTDLG